MTPLIEANLISVRAGSKAILNAVSLQLAAGETVALVGPNGAGKSTLLRVLAGELQPGLGVTKLRGRDLAAYGPRALAQHRAVLSQSISVAFPFTVAEVVAMGAGDQGGKAVDALVEQALNEVELADFSERIITTLSGGEQQRAHFARVLVQLACGEARHGPGALLLDEPTASIDLRHQLDMAASTRRCAARGVGVIAILHDLNLATVFADRIVVMDSGRIAADGKPAAVITDAMLANVFGVRVGVGQVPPASAPFILPHEAQPLPRSPSP